VDVQEANRSSTQQTLSSTLGYLLDSSNRQYDLALTTIKPGPPEGEIPPGEAVRGF
jgi:hypothetical protein